MESIDDFNEGLPQQKPVFLKVLCILTFVGSGLGILGAIVGFFSTGFVKQSMELADEMSDGMYDRMGFDMQAMLEWQTYINIGNLVGALMCLSGALIMWRLKKVGYYVYVPGALIPVIVSLVGMQYIMSGMMAGFGMIGVVFNLMISAAFIIMYGLNLKHLK